MPNPFLPKRRYRSLRQPLQLQCETLEPRTLLSAVGISTTEYGASESTSLPIADVPVQTFDIESETTEVKILLAGEMGDEVISLQIGETVVETYDLALLGGATGDLQNRNFIEVTYNTDVPVSLSDIRINFINDQFDPDNDVDRNVGIDAVLIDGVRYETEAPTTLSTGTWIVESGSTLPGYWQTEILHSNGYFRFDNQTTVDSIVEIVAAGAMGDEILALEINGIQVATQLVSQSFDSYFVELSEAIDMESDVVRIYFTNDYYVAGEVDRDLIVDKIYVDGIAYETEAETTYTTGTYVGPGLGTTGFLTSETLHNLGYFEYLAATDIVVHAAGDMGNEQIQLQLDQQTVATFDLTQDFSDFSYRHFTKVSPDRIRIAFIDDLYEPENGVDKNANVSWVSVRGQQISSDSQTVYSTGTWLAEDGIRPGYGRGFTLHTDGYFQYGSKLYPDFFEIPEDSASVPLAILANDSLGGRIDFKISAEPSHGKFEIVNGELFYTPAADFIGTDSLYYREANSEQDIRVDITVLPSHQQPQNLLNSRVADELTPSGKALLIEKVVQLPRADNGGQPRMNSMTLLGDRIFVVVDGSVNGEGKIYELVKDSNGVTTAELFLDVGTAALTATGLYIDNSSPLNGLRSLAFHPDFSNNGKLYVTYTGQRPSTVIDTPYLSDPENPVEVESVLTEFTFDFSTNVVDTTSYREVFRVGMRNSEHSIRQAIFNPFAEPDDEDYGLLYIGHGDGSEQSAVSGDGLNNDGLGKILRINPLATSENSYSVPDSNPFVDVPEMLDEAYAIGFRNPHNLTFAKDDSGQEHLIVTEIGRDNIEEINIVVAGGVYGWGDREGVFVHNPASGQINGLDNLPADEASNGYYFPNALWGHEGIPGQSFVGQAIAGGHVIQNGSSELDDQFIFVEFATDGRAYHVDFSEMLAQNTKLDPDDPENDHPDDLTWVTPQELTILFDHDNDDSTTPLVRSSLKVVLDDEPDFVTVLSAGKVRADLRLGQGPNGELYILNKRNGWIYAATNTL